VPRGKLFVHPPPCLPRHPRLCARQDDSHEVLGVVLEQLPHALAALVKEAPSGRDECLSTVAVALLDLVDKGAVSGSWRFQVRWSCHVSLLVASL
jgi:hypothetical protein